MLCVRLALLLSEYYAGRYLARPEHAEFKRAEPAVTEYLTAKHNRSLHMTAEEASVWRSMPFDWAQHASQKYGTPGMRSQSDGQHLLNERAYFLSHAGKSAAQGGSLPNRTLGPAIADAHWTVFLRFVGFVDGKEVFGYGRQPTGDDSAVATKTDTTQPQTVGRTNRTVQTGTNFLLVSCLFAHKRTF